MLYGCIIAVSITGSRNFLSHRTYRDFRKNIHGRVVASQVCVHRLAGIHRKRCWMSGGHPFSTDRSKVKTVALMIAFENISIFIVILTLLCAFGSLVIALLYLSQQEKGKAKIKMPILSEPQDVRCP